MSKAISFEKKFSSQNLGKIDWSVFSHNRNIKFDTQEQKLYKIDWSVMLYDNYAEFLKQNKKLFHEKYLFVLEDIKLLNLIPENVSTVLPKGGYDYLKMIENYKND